MKITIKISGAEQILGNLYSAYEKVANELELGLASIANEVTGDARRLAPVRKTYDNRRHRSIGLGVLTKIGSTDYTASMMKAGASSIGIDLGKSEQIRRQLAFMKSVGKPKSVARRMIARGELQVIPKTHRVKTPHGVTKGSAQRAFAFANTDNPAIRARLASMNHGDKPGRARSGQHVKEGYSGGAGPGRLRRSIQWIQGTDGNVSFVEIRAHAPYARYVEFPTHRTAAQPFLLPAFHKMRGRYTKRLAASVKG